MFNSEPSGARRRTAAARAKILNAAIRLFAERGADGATIRDVARVSGLNSGLIYYYFADKEHLFREAVAQVMDDFMERLQRRPPSFASGRDRLRHIVETGFSYYGDHPERLRLITVVITLHREVFAAGVRRLVRRNGFTPLTLVREALDGEEWRTVDPVQAWWCIVGACLITLHMRGILEDAAPRGKPPAFPPADASRLVDILFEGLRPIRRPRIRRGTRRRSE